MAEEARKVRAFVAVRLSPEVESALSQLVSELRSPGDGIRWVNPSNLHLTLHFLGAAVDYSRLGPVADELARVAAETAPFSVETRGLGAFPDLQRPRVLWAGLEGEGLLRLAQAVEAASVRCGFSPQPRAYSPHLTLGRVSDPARWRRFRVAFLKAAGREFGTSEIDRLTLYESVLSGAGPNYRVIATFRFGR